MGCECVCVCVCAVACLLTEFVLALILVHFVLILDALSFFLVLACSLPSLLLVMCTVSVCVCVSNTQGFTIFE